MEIESSDTAGHEMPIKLEPIDKVKPQLNKPKPKISTELYQTPDSSDLRDSSSHLALPNKYEAVSRMKSDFNEFQAKELKTIEPSDVKKMSSNKTKLNSNDIRPNSDKNNSNVALMESDLKLNSINGKQLKRQRTPSPSNESIESHMCHSDQMNHIRLKGNTISLQIG